MDNKEKPSKAQWIPLYGMYKAMRDACNDEPSIITEDNKVIYWINVFYQGAAVLFAYKGLEKFLE